jgi:N-acylneuraminate cytidylyltransferase
VKHSIAIIPARGGSKRLPQKNILLLGDLPLIAHSITYAKANGIEKVIVTTDDAAIKAIALEYGAEVVDRPSHLATDTSPTIDALKHVVVSLPEMYQDVILLQPTNPLRPKQLLKDAYQVYQQNNNDSLFSVTQNHHKLGKIHQHKFEPFNYTMGQRSQDLEPLYYENGLLYIAKRQLILEDKLIGERMHAYIIEHPFAKVDIDTQEDFDYAQYLLENRKKYEY